jgi:ankyrin repeat protein
MDDEIERSFHAAIAEGRTDFVERLLSQGASPNLWMKTPEMGLVTPVWLAYNYNRADIAEMLLKAGANPNTIDPRGHTLLSVLAWEHWDDKEDGAFGTLILKYNTAPWSKTGWGHTALHEAAASGNQLMLNRLIDAMVGVDCRGERSHTPFMVAAKHGNLPIMHILHRAGARWDTTDEFQADAFFFACQEGHVLEASYLLGLGVDIRRQTSTGWTALHYAARNGKMETVQLLLQCGADPYAEVMVAWSGQEPQVGTPKEIALAKRYNEIAAAIESRSTSGAFEVAWKPTSRRRHLDRLE